MCLATMAYIYAAGAVRVTIFSISGKNYDRFKFYVVTRSYSSYQFLCALATS